MTGTALTEETEFREIYGMDVVVIPTNRPVIRKDLQDAVYKTKREKLNAIVNAVEEAHATGQPVLVGTITIEASEELSRMLTKRGIQHKVLNAKFHELEAEIVADAGVHGAVTGDERDGISLIDQLHRSFHLPFFYLKFFFDFLYNIHSSS